MEERTIKVPEGKEVECLLDTLKAHFVRTAAMTPEQKEQQRQVSADSSSLWALMLSDTSLSSH